MSTRRRAKESELLFVYDRVCTKGEKEREMGREYGVGISSDNPSREQPYRGSFADEGHRQAVEAARDPASSPSRPGVTEENNRAQAIPRKNKRPISDTAWFGDRYYTRTDNWTVGRAGEDSDQQKAGSAPSGEGARARAAAFSRKDGGVYSYRPGPAEGGEAVKEKRSRIRPEWFADVFTSPEEKGREEVREVKKTAAARQRAKEYRHAALTALILTAVLALAVTAVYRTLFVVETVDVSGSALYSQEEIAAASGIREGDKLYSFRAGRAADDITFRLPWIRSAEVARKAPKSVEITLTDEHAAYYASIWGDTVLLSENLKVLSVESDPAEGTTDGLVRLILPPVDKSVAGRPLVFAGARSERYIRSVLASAAESGIMRSGLLEEIDLTGEYEIRMKAGGLYDLKCAGESDMTAKLRMAYEIIESGQLAEGIPASFDLTAVDPVTVIYDFSAAIGPN